VSDAALVQSRKDAIRTWFVRAGSAGSAARAFLDEAFVGIGWAETGSLDGVTELRAIEARLTAAFPGKSRRTLIAWAAMLRSICARMTRGDTVMTIDPVRQEYWIGQIASGYRWEVGVPLPHRRHVSWSGSIDRRTLSDSTLHCLGSISTVFRLSPAATEEVDNQFRKLGTTRASGRRPKDDTHG
jgi:predicted Mrr-cat superfamily restriction endonuclease